ncbi:MAG TPA: M1 family aminopeptidase [Allosphingosinicella sp.]|jgi:hypothetical protein
MLLKIAAFELRYQLKSPVFIAVASALFLLRFAGMSVESLAFGAAGNVMLNSALALTLAQILTSPIFSFVGAAIVAGAVLRDDETAFGPIVRASRIRKADYVFGRFLGAFALGALMMAMVPLGSWLGTLMPTASPDLVGPNRFAAYAYAYGLFGLPNAFVITAILFALAAWTRSTMGIYLGVIALFAVYVGSQFFFATRQLPSLRALADPFGLGAFSQATDYASAAEVNAGLMPLAAPLLWGRLLWIGLALLLLAATFVLFRFSEPGLSRRAAARLRGEAAPAAPPRPLAPLGALPAPRFDSRTARAQLAARARLEARHIFKSPSFFILLLIVSAQVLLALWFDENMFGEASYPRAALIIPRIHEVVGGLLAIIAVFYSGDLVWRERERRVHELVDASPLPTWTLVVSKALGLSLVLLAMLCAIVGVAGFMHLMRGDGTFELGRYLLWYLLPAGFDAALIAVLAVFVQALSPNKYAGWAAMGLYLAALAFAGKFGLEHHLFVYGSLPAVPISDMNGLGIHWQAAWWFRLFWAAAAALLLLAAHLLWPRGTAAAFRPRLRRVPARLKGSAGLWAAAATTVLIPAGVWILYNTVVLNPYRTSAQSQARLAEYERRFSRYLGLSQPTVRHVELDVALHPEDIRLEARGRYRIVNETAGSIAQVHVRILDERSVLEAVDFPAATLAHNDAEFGYRIYRLDRPMQPGEARTVGFTVRREQRGFRNSGAEERLVANGTDLHNYELAPRIGMTRHTFIDDPDARRDHGLPAAPSKPRLEDVSATLREPYAQGLITADITVSTSADQIPVAPGRKVFERVAGGRRTIRYVSAAPMMDYFSVQSGRFAVRSIRHRGVELAVYHHPAHHWNVERMLAAMRASLDRFSAAFGPYQFEQARIVESPAYRQGGQAFANTIPYSETFGFMVDYRRPNALDGVTAATAHELSHQWWGHQVRGAEMEGDVMLGETLAQYSAIMVMQQLSGDRAIRQFLDFQLDRYLSARQTSTAAELPLARGGEPHVVYGKGALAMYLLRLRLGEEAVNRALRRFVARYRLAGPPYPRSIDLIRLLREEARTPEQQGLITDLFERVTLYDLRADPPAAVRRVDGRWDVTLTLEARKFHVDAAGREREVPLAEPIEVGLFTADPGSDDFGRADVLALQLRPRRSGRQVLRFVTNRRPTHAGIDPYKVYVDGNPADNVSAATP